MNEKRSKDYQEGYKDGLMFALKSTIDNSKMHMRTFNEIWDLAKRKLKRGKDGNK